MAARRDTPSRSHTRTPCVAASRHADDVTRGYVLARAKAPRLVSPRLASSCGQKEEARTPLLPLVLPVAISNGLPMSPRAWNSVTVRAVDIADAYSMSDGSSLRGEARRGAGEAARRAEDEGGEAGCDRGDRQDFRRKSAARIAGDAV